MQILHDACDECQPPCSLAFYKAVNPVMPMRVLANPRARRSWFATVIPGGGRRGGFADGVRVSAVFVHRLPRTGRGRGGALDL